MGEPRTVDVPRMLELLGIEDLNERHGEFWACCPFPDHNERTPSWSIKEDTATHFCHGCHRGGWAADLVQRMYGFASMASAFEWLEEHGLFEQGALPLEVRLAFSRPELERLSMAPDPDTRTKPLPERITPARRYAKSRGITARQVERWQLGYAAGGYFAGRMVLPTHDRLGRLLNLTGRKWSEGKPKYKASTLAMGWDPSSVFGERYWPLDPSTETLVLCEGEINALACERMGARYVGALGGSNLEKEQVLKLSAFGTVVLAVDIDRAGTAIAEQLRATLVRWTQVHRVDFPDNRDPADLALQDPDLLKGLLCVAPTVASAV